MSKFIERSVTCANYGERFVGYGRGSDGENRAYNQAMKLIRGHQCYVFPPISGQQLDEIIPALHTAMPDVTFTRHKV